MSKQMEAQLRQAKEARADAQAEVARLKEENQRLIELLTAFQEPEDLIKASQFVSDVHTAAGLVRHGKQCKALSERLGDGCMNFLKVLASFQRTTDFRAMLAAAPAVQGEPVSHDWDDQDKCRRCGDRDWYASATCTPKQQSAPAVAALVEALELAIEYWRDRQQRYKNRKPRWVADAESALSAHRKQGGEV